MLYKSRKIWSVLRILMNFQLFNSVCETWFSKITHIYYTSVHTTYRHIHPLSYTFWHSNFQNANFMVTVDFEDGAWIFLKLHTSHSHSEFFFLEGEQPYTAKKDEFESQNSSVTNITYMCWKRIAYFHR